MQGQCGFGSGINHHAASSPTGSATSPPSSSLSHEFFVLALNPGKLIRAYALDLFQCVAIANRQILALGQSWRHSPLGDERASGSAAVIRWHQNVLLLPRCQRPRNRGARYCRSPYRGSAQRLKTPRLADYRISNRARILRTRISKI